MTFTLATFYSDICESPVTSLLLVSNLEKKTRSHYKEKSVPILMQIEHANYKDYFTQKLVQLERSRETSMKVKSGQVSTILTFKEELEEFDALIHVTARKKAEFYSSILPNAVDFKVMIDLGQETFSDIERSAELVKSLLDVNNKSLELIKKVIFYEQVVLEKMCLSKRLARLYHESHQESIKKKLAKERGEVREIDHTGEENRLIDLYSSDNAVVFVEGTVKSSFRIHSCTGNIHEIFESTERGLVGRELNSFMPGIIAEQHDEFIMNYLSGRRRQSTQGLGFNTVLQVTSEVDDKRVRHSKAIWVVPQLEYRISGNLFVVGMVSLVHQEDSLCLFTDPVGRMVGATKSVVTC